MAEQPRPEVVKNSPPTFRVRRIPHGNEADLEAALNEGIGDGYALDSLHSQANGDVLAIFLYSGPAQAEGDS